MWKQAVRGTVPAAVIAAIRRPPTQTWEGLDVAREIRSEFPQIPILLLSAHAEVDTAIELLESGDGRVTRQIYAEVPGASSR